MLLRFLLISLLLFVVSCNDLDGNFREPSSQVVNDGEGPPLQPDPQHPPKQPPSNELPETPVEGSVCFGGEARNTLPCLSVTTEIDGSEVDDYHYLQPKWTNWFPSGFSKTQYRRPVAFIDLHSIDPDTNLSKNFKLSEFMSEKKGRYALGAPVMVERLQTIRNAFDSALIVTSGYRSPGYNRSISGSARWSRHMYGDAVDFFVDGESLKDVAAACKKMNAGFVQTYRSHVHCDWRAEPLEVNLFGPEPNILSTTYHSMSVMAEHIEINVGTIDGKVILSAANVPVEDNPEDITYEWEIISSDGEIITSKEIAPELKIKGGEYDVVLTVGDTLTKHAIINF